VSLISTLADATFDAFLKCRYKAHLKLRGATGEPRKAIINVACSGKFSSDRTMKEYADDIWKLQGTPLP
jgi:starch phosphorylase